MRRSSANIFWGLLLVVIGVIFLLQTMNVVDLTGSAWIWTLLFAAAGLSFVYVFLTNRSTNWWAIIPGLALLGLAALIGMSEYLSGAAQDWAAAVFMAALALSFLVIYLVNREFWWAIIPFGVLLTVALTVGLSSQLGDAGTTGIMFLGMALTFGLLSLLPVAGGRMKWPLIPAAVLVVIGILAVGLSSSTLNYIGPAALILAGIYLVFRVLTGRKG